METQSNSDYELVCNECGHDNSNSMFAKDEGDTCRQFGCFGDMKWMPKDDTTKLRLQAEEWNKDLETRRRMARLLIGGLQDGSIQIAEGERLRKADLFICSYKRMDDEAIEGKCADCNDPIFFDPGYPDGPKKICLRCALASGQQSLAV